MIRHVTIVRDDDQVTTLLARQLPDDRRMEHLFAEVRDEVVLARQIERPPFKRGIFDVERSEKINILIAESPALTAIQLSTIDLRSTRFQQELAYQLCFRMIFQDKKSGLRRILQEPQLTSTIHESHGAHHTHNPAETKSNKWIIPTTV